MARTAEITDFKTGNTLTSSGYDFTIIGKYDEGVWEARGASGVKCLFEREAKKYTVKC